MTQQYQWFQQWKPCVFADPTRLGESSGPVGYASTEPGAQEKMRELEAQNRALHSHLTVQGIEDLTLFNNYWWPAIWPGSDAWAIYYHAQGDTP